MNRSPMRQTLLLVLIHACTQLTCAQSGLFLVSLRHRSSMARQMIITMLAKCRVFGRAIPLKTCTAVGQAALLLSGIYSCATGRSGPVRRVRQSPRRWFPQSGRLSGALRLGSGSPCNLIPKRRTQHSGGSHRQARVRRRCPAADRIVANVFAARARGHGTRPYLAITMREDRAGEDRAGLECSGSVTRCG
jgi:hypothetical protein